MPDPEGSCRPRPKPRARVHAVPVAPPEGRAPRPRARSWAGAEAPHRSHRRSASPWRGGHRSPRRRGAMEHAACEPSPAHAHLTVGAGGPPSAAHRRRPEGLRHGATSRPVAKGAQPSAPLTRGRIAVYPLPTTAKQLVVAPDAVPSRCVHRDPVGWPTSGSVGTTGLTSTSAVRAPHRRRRPAMTSEANPIGRAIEAGSSAGLERLRWRPTRASHGLALDGAASSCGPEGRPRRSGPRQ